MSYLDELLEKRDSESTRANGGPVERFVWWEAPNEDFEKSFGEEYVNTCRANSLMYTARALENAQADIHQQNLWSAQLYSNRELAAFDWGTGTLVRASLAPVSRTTENIVVRVVETLVSVIGKNRPKPKPVARGASFHTRQNIRKLDKFLYGEFQRNKLYSLTKGAYRDAQIFQFGCIKVSVEDDERFGARVCYEKVFPDEILVDQMEVVATGKVRHLYRRRALPVSVVSATYGVSEEELRQSGAVGFAYLDYRPVGSDWVIIIEGYHCGSKDVPGRWMVATNNIVLDEGTWEHEWTPYVFYQYQPPPNGWYGPSAVEQALTYQIRLNEINDVIRDAQDVMARPRILVAEGSRVNPMEIDNVIGRFVKYTGIKPEAITWSAMNAEIYNERERLIRACLDQFGLSDMIATATPPPNARFDSSAAFREFNAIQDGRLSDPAQRFEDFHLEIAERTVDVIAASGKNPKTTWYSGWKKSRAETIEWAEIKLDRDSYIMTMEATSIFAMSPSAARDELEKQLATGLITPEQYRLQLSDMDTEGLYSLQAAAAEDLNRVQELLETGDYETPIPEQDLVNGITQMTLALLDLGKYPDTPEDVKLNFVNWITTAKAIVNKGTEETDATTETDPMAAMGGMPGMDPLSGGLAGPDMMPVPEAAGLAPAGPGPMPNIT